MNSGKQLHCVPCRKDIPLLHWPSSFQPSSVFPISLSSFLKSFLFSCHTFTDNAEMTKGFYYSQHRSQRQFHLFPMASSPRRGDGQPHPVKCCIHSEEIQAQRAPVLKSDCQKKSTQPLHRRRYYFYFSCSETKSSAPDWTTIYIVQLFPI